jgi:hypothetical protein
LSQTVFEGFSLPSFFFGENMATSSSSTQIALWQRIKTADVDGGLASALTTANVDARYLDILKAESIETLADFKGAYESDTQLGALSVNLLKALHEKVPELKEARVHFARLKTLWEIAAKSLTEQAAVPAKSVAAVLKEANDWEVPLGDDLAEEMALAWTQRYGTVIEHLLFPGDSLTNRTHREFRRWSMTVTEVTKMRSNLMEQTPTPCERHPLSDTLDITSKAMADYRPGDVLGYYWGLRVLANAWGRCGNYMVPSAEKENTTVLMMPWDQALNYADRALRVTMATGMPWSEQLPWLERKDRLTRSIMAGFVRERWPAGEALRKALIDTASDWSYVRSSEVISTHQARMGLDTGLHFQNTTPFQKGKGGKATGISTRVPRSRKGGNGKGGNGSAKGGGKAKFNSGAAKVASTQPGSGKKICGAFNSKKGCRSGQKGCPNWGEHVCGVMENGRMCGATNHGASSHSKHS